MFEVYFTYWWKRGRLLVHVHASSYKPLVNLCATSSRMQFKILYRWYQFRELSVLYYVDFKTVSQDLFSRGNLDSISEKISENNFVKAGKWFIVGKPHYTNTSYIPIFPYYCGWYLSALCHFSCAVGNYSEKRVFRYRVTSCCCSCSASRTQHTRRGSVREELVRETRSERNC